MNDSSSIESRAARSAVLITLGRVSQLLLRLGSNVVMSRLLYPEAFGLMAMVYVVLYGLHMMSDVGIRQSIVRHERGDEADFLNTAWTMQLLRGAGMCLVTLIIATPYARTYDKPELIGLLSVCAVLGLVQGADSTKLLSHSRHLAVGRLVLIDLATQVLGFIAMVTHALLHPSVWALVTGALFSAVAKAVLSHTILPGQRNRLRWERESARELTSFGRWVFVSSFVTILSQKFDVLALGRLLAMDQLGVYSLALVVVTAPREVVVKLSGEVLLPVLSAAHRTSREDLASRYAAAHRAVMPAMLAVVVGAGLAAPPMFHLLFDARYHDAGWMALIGMLGTWFFLQGTIAADTLVALGNSKRLAAASATRAVAVPLGGLVGYGLGGLPGFLVGYSLGQLPPYVVATRAVAEHGIRMFSLDLRYTLMALGLGLAGGLLPVATGSSLSVPHRALLETAALALIVAGLAPWVARSILPVLRRRRAAG